MSFQKQSSRNLILSPSQQAAYGAPMADAALTVRQRFDPSTVFEAKPSNRTDKMMSGKGSEWATDDQITAWDASGTVKAEAEAFLMGWMLAFIFGQEVATGAGPYTHTYTLPSVTATMPCTTVYVEETNDVKRKFADMAAKSLSIDVPERGAVSVSLDMVGTGRHTPGAMAVLPALVAANYLLGSDVFIKMTPSSGTGLVNFVGRQKGLSIKVDRGSAPFLSSGDGFFAQSVNSGDGKFSVDLTISAQQADEVNGWFESGVRCDVSIATNPALQFQFGFSWPSARFKANKVSNTNGIVTWSLSWDENSSISVGAQPAMSAFVINTTPAYLMPV